MIKVVELSAQEAIARLKMDESQIGAIQQQMRAIVEIIEENRKAIETLKGLPKKETEASIPIGGGVMIPGKLGAQGMVKVNIGAGIVVEQAIEDAIAKLEKRVKGLEEEMKKIQESGQAINFDALKIRKKLGEYMARQKSEGDVPVIG